MRLVGALELAQPAHHLVPTGERQGHHIQTVASNDRNVDTKYLDEALRERGRNQGLGAKGRRTQRRLVAVELAVTLTLVCGASLLLRSLMHVEQVPLGFDAANARVFRVVVPDAFSLVQRQVFYDQAVEHLVQMLRAG